MLYWISKKSGQINSQQLEHVVKRNFGGGHSNDVDTWQVFKEKLGEIMPYVPKVDAANIDVSCSFAQYFVVHFIYYVYARDGFKIQPDLKLLDGFKMGHLALKPSDPAVDPASFKTCV